MERDLGDEVVVIPAEQWAEAVARRVAAALEAAIAARGAAALALAGGTTPRPAYRALARLPLPWDRIDCYFGDERAVPPEHPDANYQMAAEALLDPAGVPAARRHRMPAERADREAAAREYGEPLPERLDLLLLGIGGDGHTLSLFPGSWALGETARRVVAVEAPVPPHGRLTLTFPPIAAARARLVLARGAAKASVVAHALDGPADVAACPAQLARPAVWLLDPGAASRLAWSTK